MAEAGLGQYSCALVRSVFMCHCPPRSVSVTPIRVAGISQRRSWQGVQGAGIQRLLSAAPPLPLHPHRYGSVTHSPTVVTVMVAFSAADYRAGASAEERRDVSSCSVSSVLWSSVCLWSLIGPSCPLIRNSWSLSVQNMPQSGLQMGMSTQFGRQLSIGSTYRVITFFLF